MKNRLRGTWSAVSVFHQKQQETYGRTLPHLRRLFPANSSLSLTRVQLSGKKFLMPVGKRVPDMPLDNE